MDRGPELLLAYDSPKIDPDYLNGNETKQIELVIVTDSSYNRKE
jgi:hypothetical protein